MIHLYERRMEKPKVMLKREYNDKTKVNHISNRRPMEQTPSLEANSRSAGQEIPLLLWNPKFHYWLL
jgi:hypothetical protein